MDKDTDNSRDNSRDKGIQILSAAQVIKKTGLSRSTLYRQARDGNFPLPVKLTERRIGWKLGDVEEWLRSREEGHAPAPFGSHRGVTVVRRAV